MLKLLTKEVESNVGGHITLNSAQIIKFFVKAKAEFFSNCQTQISLKNN